MKKRKDLKILIIANTTVEPGMSGGTRILIELARGWLKRKVKVVIHTSKTGKSICQHNLLKGASYDLWPAEKYEKLGIFVR